MSLVCVDQHINILGLSVGNVKFVPTSISHNETQWLRSKYFCEWGKRIKFSATYCAMSDVRCCLFGYIHAAAVAVDFATLNDFVIFILLLHFRCVRIALSRSDYCYDLMRFAFRGITSRPLCWKHTRSKTKIISNVAYSLNLNADRCNEFDCKLII